MHALPILPASAVSASPEPPIAVDLDHVSKRFGDVQAVREATFQVRRGEFFSLLGPSGCGKTTLLRMIAGFEQPTGGHIRIEGDDVTAAPPQARPTAMVFQNYALFPTMTVGENVGYGLRVRKVPRAERDRRVREVLERVDLGGLEARPVTQLSGGQQQRVALARALAVRPAVLLFDEPLSNLDVALREQTRRELKALQHDLGTTSVYVTHDQQEALALSDRIAVMRAGRVLQIGPPRELYHRPATAFVAQFLGSNVVRDPGVAERLAGEAPPEGHVLSVRPEHLQPASDGPLPARLRTRQFLGSVEELLLDAAGTPLRAWVLEAVEAASALRALRWSWVEDDLGP